MKAAELIAKANYLKAPSPAVVQLLTLLAQSDGDNDGCSQKLSRCA